MATSDSAISALNSPEGLAQGHLVNEGKTSRLRLAIAAISAAAAGALIAYIISYIFLPQMIF